VFETPFRLAANRLPLSCSAGVRFLPRLKAGVSSEVLMRGKVQGITV